MSNTLATAIEKAYSSLLNNESPGLPQEYMGLTDEFLALLDKGSVRVAEPTSDGGWKTNQWVQKGILFSMRIKKSTIQKVGEEVVRFDKLALKYDGFSQSQMAETGVRIVPGAKIRQGSFLSPGVVAMPCFVNIGAYVGKNTMIDTWSTVGSGAQIGNNVHLSGGVGIGGVLEPIGASPVIIEDDCFIGARSEVVEGVRIGKGSVLAMGVYISQSTKIYDRTTKKIFKGDVPPGSVIVPGSLPAEDGSHSLSAAIIIKKVDLQTKSKTSINDLLRP